MPIAAKTYVLTGDDRAVEHDGTKTGSLLVAAGGTIDADVAKRYGVSLRADKDVAAERDAIEQERLDAITARRVVPVTGAQGTGATADAAAAASAAQNAAAFAAGTSPLDIPRPDAPAPAPPKAV